MKKIKDVAIAASSFAVPDRTISNDQLSQWLDTSDEWISKRTGIKERHISSGENTSDLATRVAKSLLSKSGLSAEQIDLIVVATMSPDNMTPSTAAIVQGKIGAKKAIAFDISAACSGFSYAFTIARSLLLTQHLQNAIVIGAEVLSKLIDWQDRSTAVLFGDGAGGVLLTACQEQHVLGIDLRTFGWLGDKIQAGHLGANADFRQNKRQLSAFQMEGREVYRFSTHQTPLSIEAAAKQAHLRLKEIDYFLLHQANQRIIKQVAIRLQQPLSKFPMNIDRYGNTAAASEAILLAECIAKKVITKGKIIALTGFGGGLTTATIIFKY